MPATRPVVRTGVRTVVVTRPRPQADEWAGRLCEAGVPAIAIPLLAIEPVPDPASVVAAWQAMGAAAAADGLPPAVMFVSANAVQAFFHAIPGAAVASGPARAPAPDPAPAASSPSLAWPERLLALATGPGTSRALVEAGVPPRAVVAPPEDAPRFDSEALWARTQALGLDWRDRPLWIVRGQEGRDWFSSTAAGAGARVQAVTAYLRRDGTTDPAVREALAATEADASRWLWHFSSSEALGHLVAATPARDWSTSRALASHPRIVQSVRDAGFGRVDLVGVAIEDVVRAALAG